MEKADAHIQELSEPEKSIWFSDCVNWIRKSIVKDKRKRLQMKNKLARVLPKKVNTKVVFILAFALIGAAFLIITQAATPSLSVEPENGQLSGAELKEDDPNASGGKYIQFGSGTLPAPSNCAQPGQSITQCIDEPGGQELIIKNGTYIGGTITAPHTGWLILKAQSQGGVTIDMSTTGLTLGAGTNKVVFVGFKFVNGMISTTAAKDLVFWYTEHSFPPEVWLAQYQAKGGTTITTANCSDMLAVRASMANPFPSAIRGKNGDIPGGTVGQKTNIGWYGVDMHHFGDDGMFFSGVNNTKIIGTRIWHIIENGTGTANTNSDFQIGPTSLDPADQNAVKCPSLDWWHNDSLQSSGGSGLTLTDNSWDMHPFLGGDNASTSGLVVDRIWGYGPNFAGTKGGFYFISRGPTLTITGTVNNVRTFNTAIPILEEKQDLVSGATVVTRKVWPQTFGDSTRLPSYVGGVTAAVTNAFPPGISTSTTPCAGTNMTCAMHKAILDHQDNPANKWRLANPYNNYRTYLGI